MSEMLLGAPGVACEGAPTPQGAPRAAGAMASGWSQGARAHSSATPVPHFPCRTWRGEDIGLRSSLVRWAVVDRCFHGRPI